MKRSRAAAFALVLALSACGGGDGDTPPTTDADLITDLDQPVAGFGGAVNRANDVADAANDRLGDIQNQLDN